jgi:transposase InsO family protein
VGIPPDPRRTDEARPRRCAVHRVGDPACRGHRSGAAPLGPDLAAVPARPGRRDPRRGFPARGHRAAEETVRPGVHRARHPPDALGGVTANPTGEWTVQQARNLALTLGERFEDIKFLIRDRGSNFTASFDAVFQAAGTRILRTAVQAPRMNAICERLVGTLRRELLDRVLILGEAHLRAVLTEYQAHYNTARPHQGIAQRVPDDEHDAPRATVADLDRTTDPPKTRPGRPDQRIHARRLTHPEDLAGHQPNPIFERDRCNSRGRGGRRRIGWACTSQATGYPDHRGWRRRTRRHV